MWRTSYTTFIWVVTAFTIVNAEIIQPVTTNDSSHLFVKMLEARYDAYLKAAKTADVEAYKQTRTSDTVKFMEDHLRKQGKLNEFGSIIQAMALYDHKTAEFQFVACDAEENIARLSYMRDSQVRDASSQPRVEFLIIMFHLEDGVWRIGYMKHGNAPKIKEDGTPTKVSDFTADERFRLPSEQ